MLRFALCLSLLPVLAAAAADLEPEFLDPGMETRALLGPLFWMHGDESPERLREYVDIVWESGHGSLTAESRPHNDWLGEKWYRDLGIVLDQAKKRGLKLWIFDEKWWPSGEVGGIVPQEYASKCLKVTVREPDGSGDTITHGGKHHVVTLLGKRTPDGIDGDSLVEAPWLGGLFKPADGWTVMNFTWEDAGNRGGRGYLVDGASQDAVDWYIETVYQPHYDRFPEDFGDTIQGFFYDEPETIGDWGTEVIPLLKERGVDWKRALVAWKVGLADPQEQAAAKYAYQDAFAEAWGRTMYGGISNWCRDHNVTSIGHWLEHNWEYLDAHRSGGNMVQLQKYTDMGGIDVVFAQFVWGKRDMGVFYTPKLGSSITHAYGKKDDLTMVEIYGARGQDLTYPEMKWWLDHCQVSGVNFIIPHSFNPRAPFDRDCPPYFYNGGYEPRYPLYRVWADYSARLTHMLTGGRHVCPVAFLYAGNSYHVGEGIRPEQMTGALQDALYDCDWIPYEVLENDMEIEGKALVLRDERYRVLVVPPVEVISPAALAQARDFFDRGGVVLGYGIVPTKSADLDQHEAYIRALREAIWGVSSEMGLTVRNTNADGGRAYLLPREPTPEQVQQVLADAGVRPTLEVLEGDTGHWLHVLHRVKDGRDIFFVTNQNVHDEPRTFRLLLRAQGTPECWDPMRAEVTAVPHRKTSEGSEVTLTLAANESIFLVMAEEERKLPPRGVREDAARLAVDAVPYTGPRSLDPATLDDQRKAEPLMGSQWIWSPEPNNAPMPGVRYLRRTWHLPADLAFQEATVRICADNSFVLYINGKRVCAGSRWDMPETVSIKSFIRTGPNQLAVRAENGGEGANPAGCIAVFQAEAGGKTFALRTDDSWRTASEAGAGWKKADFDDSAWQPAHVLGGLGIEPWGMPGTVGRTLPPVRTDDPYQGVVTVTADTLRAAERIQLVADGLPHDEGARVTINGAYAGGFIGRPYRLDVTPLLKEGENTIQIQPFAPESVALLLD